MALADDIERALRAAPESRRDASIAVTAAMAGGDVERNAQATAQLLNVKSTQAAVDRVARSSGGRGIWGATLGWLGGGVKGATDLLGDGISNTLKYANKPLEQVQQEYRYLRDVTERHGFGAALLAGLPMMAGGAIGAAVTGGAGTAFGASLGQTVGGWLAEEVGLPGQYRDSWERVAKGEEYTDKTGQKVSPGRDAARFLGALTKHIGVNIEQHEGFDLYDAVSGIGDGLFTIAADPLSATAGLSKTAKTVGLKGGIAGGRYGGTVLDKGTDIARVTAQYPAVKRALENLATMDEGTIVARHKKLAPFAKDLGEADTWEKVGQVLVDNADAAQMRLRYLPRRGIANAPFAQLVQNFQEKASEMALAGGAQGPAQLQLTEESGRLARARTGLSRRVGSAATRATTFVPTSFNQTTKALSRETLYFNDPNSARTIYDMAKWGHNERMARAVAKDWATGDVDRRMTIFRNVMVDNMVNRMEAVMPGWSQTPEGAEAIARIGDRVDIGFAGIDAGRTTAWGYDQAGRIISKMPYKGGTSSVPIFEFQHYNVPMPDYLTFDRNLKALGNGSELYGKVDDFMYDHFTKSVFKRWALLSGGFALRNSAADAIPFIARDPKKFAKAKLAASARKHGWHMEPEDEDNVRAVVGRFLGRRLDMTDDELTYLVHSQMSSGGHRVAEAARAGHETGLEIVGVESYVSDELYNLRKEAPSSVRLDDEGQAWKGDHVDAHTYWHKQIKEMAEQSPAAQAAAAKMREVLSDPGRPFGMSEEEFAAKAKELHARVRAAEKVSDPATWTAAEKAANAAGDWRTFSKLRGYTDAEITEFEEFLKFYEIPDYQHKMLGPDDVDLKDLYQEHRRRMPSIEQRAEELANAAADEAAERAVRRAAARKVAPEGAGEAGEEGAEEAIPAIEAAAKRAAARAAKEAADEEIPPGVAAAKSADNKPKLPEAPLSEELQEIVARARQRAYDAAYAAAIKTGQEGQLNEATAAAIAAAKEALDNLPEEVLNQHTRHFHASVADEASPGNSENWKWVPAKEATGGKPSVKPHWEYQPPVRNAPLVSPTKVGAGHYEHVAEEGTYVLRKSGKQWVLTTPDKGDQVVETWGKGVEQMSRRVARQPEFVPGIVEKPTGMVRVLDEPAAAPMTPKDPHDDWAQVIVETLKGSVIGSNGTIHDDLLDAIGQGMAPDIMKMAEIPIEARPNKIMGAYEKPQAPKRFADDLFRKLNTFMNWAAREPIYIGAQLDEYKAFKPLIDAGEMTMDEARVVIDQRALNAILPHIDNSMERSLMAEHMRNWIPFYAAQQQAYARMFRLLSDDPLAFRRVQLGFTQLANFGGIYDDESNNSHMVLPGLGWLTGGAAKAMGELGIPVVGSMPTTFSGSLKSLASVSPIMEGGEFFKPGPLIAISVRAVNNLLPETRQLTDPIMGDMAGVQSMWEMLVPNATIRNLMNTFINEDNRTMTKSTLDAIQALEYKQNVEMRKWVEAGKDPADPNAPRYVPGPEATDMERWTFIDRVTNQSRILSIFKAVVGSVSPVAPSIQLGDVGLKTELYDSIKEKGISVAINEFLEKNPDATPYAVFQTESGTPSPIDSTHEAQQWVDANLGFITHKDFSYAASYFIPQTDDKFNQEVYNDQMSMGLRRRKSPEQLIRDIQISKGNRWYFDKYKPAKDAAVGRARSAAERRRIGSEFAKTGDPANGIASFELMKQQNPIWYTNFSSGGRDAERSLALAQMRAAIQQGVAPPSPMTERLAGLLKDLDAHQQAMVPGRTDSYASNMRKQEDANWQSYLKRVADEEPQLTMAINNIFRGA